MSGGGSAICVVEETSVVVHKFPLTTILNTISNLRAEWRRMDELMSTKTGYRDNSKTGRSSTHPGCRQIPGDSNADQA